MKENNKNSMFLSVRRMLSKQFLFILGLGAVGLITNVRLWPLSNDSGDFLSAGTLSSSQTSKSKSSVQQITILGERNSGTRWTFAHMQDCFNHSLIVRRRLTRYKHWFQHYDPSLYTHDTVVLAQFRNPYEWLRAMEAVPHHSPAHIKNRYKNMTNITSWMVPGVKDWKEFLTKAWTMPRIGEDLDESAECQELFRYKDLVSCVKEPIPKSEYPHDLRFSENQPFYEMRNDGSGLPYNNIMEMRTDKIRNFLKVKGWPGVHDVWILRYEELLEKGTQGLIDRISKLTGVKPQCTPYPAQPGRKKRDLLPDFVQHIRNNLNWTVEEMIGYAPNGEMI